MVVVIDAPERHFEPFPELVDSYAHLARRWWVTGRGGHGPACHCLPCAELRAERGMAPLVGQLTS